jgi:hypothetical protein
MVGYTSVIQRWRTDTCVPSFCKLYDVVTGKKPRLWNCPKSSCHGAFPDTYLRGTRGVVLLSSRVWKDVNGWALETGISCTYSNPVVTGGQKHTHMLLNQHLSKDHNIVKADGFCYDTWCYGSTAVFCKIVIHASPNIFILPY